MRFLHTGDWHLGKVFHEVSLIEDQREFLRQVCEELEAARKGGNPYSALYGCRGPEPDRRRRCTAAGCRNDKAA